MTVITKDITLQTEGNCDITDITFSINEEVISSGMSNGTITVFVCGSTAAVTTIEFEPGLIHDLEETWHRLVPQNIPYRHNQAWGDGNGHAHVRAALLGPSLVIPFVSKKLTLGTWQQIVCVDFDNRHRSRKIVLQIMGE
jgi:secondary thiamine-phosphate synthase enzyme